MATCPKCMGALTENHRCRGSVFRRAGHVVAAVAVGGGLGAVTCFAIEDRPAGILVMAAAALGAVLATAVQQAAGGGRP